MLCPVELKNSNLLETSCAGPEEVSGEGVCDPMGQGRECCPDISG